VNAIVTVLSLFVVSLLLAGCLSGSSQPQSNNNTPSVIDSANNSGFQPATGVVLNGSKVTAEYVGTLENGTMFDTNIASEAAKQNVTLPADLPPFMVTIGLHQVIPGFEKALLGMKVGQEKTVSIPVADAYGEPNPQMIVEINGTELDQGNSTAKVGMYVTTPYGQRGLITNVTNGTIMVDFNHPLAGKNLVFKIIVKKIE